MPGFDEALIIIAALLLVGVLANKLSDRLGVPALVLFLVIGMAAGTEGVGGIPFDDAGLAQILGIVALSFILFAGGIETEWRNVAPVLWKGLRLATIGVVVTALVAGKLASLFLGISWREGLLLGSIMSSTDAAAVFAVLRSRGVSLKGLSRPLLELESGSNDPMAVFLTMALIQTLSRPENPLPGLAVMFVLQMVIGAAIGYAAGKGAVWLINRLKLEADGLYPVLTISVVLLTYGLASVLRGNGFLAVYLAGIFMGNSDFIHKRSLVRFHNGLAWLMQITMFVALGLLVFPSRLLPVAGSALLVTAVLMVAARPAGVFFSLAFSGMTVKQKLLISWVGLRGAVPIVLATYPLVAGLPNSELYFDVVFFVVLTSVLIQGATIPFVARRLGLHSPLAPKREYPLEYVSRGTTRNDLVEVPVPADSPVAGQRVVDIGLPKSSLIVLLGRDDDFLVPRGGTVLQAGDMLLVLAEKGDLVEIRSIVDPHGTDGR